MEIVRGLRRLAAASLALLGACGGSVLEQSFTVEPGGTLRAEVDFGDADNWNRGSLEVASHDQPEVRLEADSRGWGGWGIRLAAAPEGSDVVLRGRVAGPAYRWFGGPTLRIKVLVPTGYGLDARTTGGRMRLHDLGGEVRARSDDDDIRITGAAGSVDVQCRRGKVFVKEVRGNARISTERSNISVESVDGDVEATSEWGSIGIELVGGGVRARTARGSIEMREVAGAVAASTELGDVDLVDVGGPLDVTSRRGRVAARFTGDPAGKVETDIGAIVIRLPTDAKLELEAKTRKGTIRLDGVFWLEGDLTERSGAGTINGGGEKLLLRSGTGSIDLDAR